MISDITSNARAASEDRHLSGLAWIFRLWRRRAIILVAVAASVAAGVGYLTLTTHLYTSTAVLAPASIEGDAPANLERLYGDIDVIRSSHVLESAMQSPGVREMRTFVGLSDPVSWLKEALKVDVSPTEGTLHVSLSSPFPAEAATLLNAVVEAFMSYQTKREVADRSSALDVERDHAAAEQSQRLRELTEFREANPTFITPESADAIGAQLSKLTDALTAAQIDAASAKAALEATRPLLADPKMVADLVRANRPKGMFGPLDQQTDQLEAEVAPLDKQLAMQRGAMGPQNPVLLATQSKIDTLRAKEAEIEARKGAIFQASLEQQAATASRKVGELQALVGDQRKLAQEYVAGSARFATLNRQFTAAEEKLLRVEAARKDLRTMGDAGGIALKVVELARPSTTAAFPVPTQILTTAIVAGLLLGLCAASIPYDKCTRSPHVG